MFGGSVDEDFTLGDDEKLASIFDEGVTYMDPNEGLPHIYVLPLNHPDLDSEPLRFLCRKHALFPRFYSLA